MAWSKQLNRPYESGWALTLRFCILNQPGRAYFKKLFFQDANSHGSDKYLHPDFARPDSSRYSSTKFNRVFGLSEKDFDMLFFGYYGLALFDYSNPSSFKYCPLCLAIGYHSPIHLAKALRLCPIHKVPLKSTCNNCGKLLSMHFVSQNPNHNYTCERCGARPYNEDNIEQLCSPLADDNILALDEFVKNAKIMADDPRQYSWVIDHLFHTRNDICAYGLFARATGMPDSFSNLFYCTDARVRRFGILKNSSQNREPPLDMPCGPADSIRYKRDNLINVAYKVLDRIDNLCIIRTLKANTANGSTQDIRVLAEHRRGLLIGDVTGTPCERWHYYLFCALSPSCTGYTYQGAIRKLAADIACMMPSENEFVELSEDDWTLNKSLFRWCVRKIFAATFVCVYRWAVALQDAERGGFVTNKRRGYLIPGNWAMPRFYYLRLKDDIAIAELYCTHQNVSSESFDGSIFDDVYHRNESLYKQMLLLWGKALQSFKTRSRNRSNKLRARRH